MAAFFIFKKLIKGVVNVIQKANQDIRQAKGIVPWWMVADKLGISVATIYIWLRHEMPKEKKDRVLAAIDECKNEIRRSIV